MPGSVLIPDLVCHSIPLLAWCSQLPVTVPPLNPYHTIIRVHNGSMAGVALKRPVVNEQHKQKTPLVLHLPAFNDMDSAPIKAASLELRPHSFFFFLPSAVSSALYSLASTANRVVSEREREWGCCLQGIVSLYIQMGYL